MIFENAIRSGMSGYLGKIYVVSVNATKTLVIDSYNSHILGRSQPLPYAERKSDNTVSLERILTAAGNFDLDFVLEVDLKLQIKQRKHHSTFLSVPLKETPMSEYVDF